MKILTKIYSIVKVHNLIDLSMEILEHSMCVLLEFLKFVMCAPLEVIM